MPNFLIKLLVYLTCISSLLSIPFFYPLSLLQNFDILREYKLLFYKKSPRCLEYIIVHEMVHLLEKGHNAKFYAYMDRFLPSWKSIKAQLNGMKYK